MLPWVLLNQHAEVTVKVHKDMLATHKSVAICQRALSEQAEDASSYSTPTTSTDSFCTNHS